MKAQVLFLFFSASLFGQSTYTSANYATTGDNLYLTNCSNLTLDYLSTGTNFSWNFSSLTGVSQNNLLFRNPTATGFSLFTFPFIFNANNTNLSSTDGSSSTLTTPNFSIGFIDTNEYFKKTTTDLKQVASSFKVSYNGILIPVTNQFTTPDVVYQFPINYGNSNSSNASYTTNIPTLYYQNKTISRSNLVDGWGTLTTPFGTFSNTLRMTTNLVENDTIAVGGIGLPRVIRTSRELKWFDAVKKYPVLVVTQNNTAGNWVTTKVQYLDNLTYFQPTALFAYSPLAPTAGATVFFQNLSTNATTYSWNFGDPTSGSLNTSSTENASHVFNTNGVYQVVLTVTNPNFSNSIIISVVVSSILGANENNFENKNIVYPNPFTNSIHFTNSDENNKYVLLNFEGEILYSGNSINSQDFSSLSSGIYFVEMFNDTQKKTYKIIKN